MKRMRLAALAPMLLIPGQCLASFGGGCGNDFGCYFSTLGILMGFFGGIPITIFVYVAIALQFCNPERSKVREAVIAGGVGIAAWLVAAAVYSAIAVKMHSSIGYNERAPHWGLLGTLLVVAVLIFFRVRSEPR